MQTNRRTFIKSTATTTMAVAIAPTVALSSGQPDVAASDVAILATNWGFTGTPAAFCKKVKQEGYDGVEIWWPTESKEQDHWFSALRDQGLSAGFLCAGHGTGFDEHLKTFIRMTEAAATNTHLRPLYINCHSGRDFFTFEENAAFIRHTNELARTAGVLICHETHRSRMLYSAPASRAYLTQHPDLRVTFDLSHWCNVSESLLEDQQETVDLAIAKTGHIHARVGHAEGPQVSDPRAPEWQDALNAHLKWWDAIVGQKRKKGERITILTEFGPPDYMGTMPYTRKPLADQWAINVHMMQLLRKRYTVPVK